MPLPRQVFIQNLSSGSITQDVSVGLGGLNARDGLGDMQPTDAIEMTNLVPSTQGAVSRGGYESFATGLTGDIRSLIEYIGSAGRFFLSASGGNIDKVATGGGVTNLASGYSSNIWSHAALGDNYVLVNEGSEDPQLFDGTTVSAPSYSGDISSVLSSVDNAHSYRNRVYLWDTGSGDFYYGGVNAVSGAFTKFELSKVSDTAGNIIEMITISRDGGSGMDDFAAFLLDTGEVILYQGSNPGDATNWALVGKYFISPIVAKGCVAKFGGDVLVLTRNDVVSLRKAIESGTEAGGVNLNPTKLSSLIEQDYLSYKSNSGWQLIAYPNKAWIIINVPTAGSTSHQYGINAVNGSSFKFTGWNTMVFGVLAGDLYFGGSQEIFKADSGLNDNGSGILVTIGNAYTNFGVPKNKTLQQIKLYLSAEDDLNVSLSIGTDYKKTGSASPTASSAISQAEWDEVEWDLVDWAGSENRVIVFAASGLGLALSSKFEMNIVNQEVKLYKVAYVYTIAETI